MKLEDLGRLVATKAISDLQESNHDFSKFIVESLGRYLRNDWGDLSKDDKKKNDKAVKYVGDRIMASYPFPTDAPWKAFNDWGVKENKIWIITEWDRSITTILFSGEY